MRSLRKRTWSSGERAVLRRQRRPLRVLIGVAVSLAALRLISSDWSPVGFLSAPLARPALRSPIIVRRAEAVTSPAAVGPLQDSEATRVIVDAVTGQVDVSDVPAVTGVYAVYDNVGDARYVGISRSIRDSIAEHAEVLGADAPGMIRTVRCSEMRGASRETLRASWELWASEAAAELGRPPAGNLPDGTAGSDRRWRGDAELAKVKAMVSDNHAVLFMKGTPARPRCGFSARAVRALGTLGADYAVVDVAADTDRGGSLRDAVKRFGAWPTLPQLYVGGELLGGADLIEEMVASGELERRLEGGDDPAPFPAASRTSSPSDRPVDSFEEVDPSRPIASAIARALRARLRVQGLRVIDDSARHTSHFDDSAGSGESHFTVDVVASEFEGLSPVERQKLVFDALSDIIPQIHALTLATRTPAEAT